MITSHPVVTVWDGEHFLVGIEEGGGEEEVEAPACPELCFNNTWIVGEQAEPFRSVS